MSDGRIAMSDGAESDSGWLRISLVEHYAYCPRQAYLLADGVWADNHLTVQGTAGHERVDSGGTDHRRGVVVHHRVPLASQRLRLHGFADAVEEHKDGRLLPVEHKRGRGAGDLFPSLAQVVAQALCLEEMLGMSVPEVAVYVTKERRRELYRTEDYSSRVEALIRKAHASLHGEVRPKFSARLCNSCSVQNACQPRGAQWQ